MIEEKIQRAIEDGAFKELPGKGKPIQFDGDQNRNSEHWLVNKVLKNADLLPPWLELDKEIRSNLETLEQILLKHSEFLKEQKQSLLQDNRLLKQKNYLKSLIGRHQSQKKQYIELLLSINPKIKKMNLLVPFSRLQKNVICEHQWIERFKMCSNLYLGILQETQNMTLLQSKQKRTIWSKIKFFMLKWGKVGGEI